MRRLSLVVEGDGDQVALPIVIRNYLNGRNIFDVEVGKAINAKGRPKLLADGALERFARLAALQPNAVAVLVLCDSDDDLVCQLGPAISERCKESIHIPIRACLAVKKFENWIVASAETLNQTPLADSANYESVSSLPILQSWRAPQKYIKPIHQPSYSAALDLDLVSDRCPSFARLLRCVDELIQITA